MKRILTAMIGIPFVIAFTLYSPHWLFALIIAAFAGMCVNELRTFGASRAGARPGTWAVLAGAAAYLLVAGSLNFHRRDTLLRVVKMLRAT